LPLLKFQPSYNDFVFPFGDRDAYTYTQTPIQCQPRLVFVTVREHKFPVMQHFDLPPPSIYCQKLWWTTSGNLSGLFLSLFTPR